MRDCGNSHCACGLILGARWTGKQKGTVRVGESLKKAIRLANAKRPIKLVAAGERVVPTRVDVQRPELQDER